jgi:hypothetical protein
VEVTLYILATLFVAKLVWNIGVPIASYRRERRGEPSSISLTEIVELSLLAAMVVVSTFADLDDIDNSLVGAIGAFSIAASYILMFGVGVVLGRLRPHET